MNRLTRAARDQWRKELAEKGLFKDYDMKSVLTRLLDDLDALEHELEIERGEYDGLKRTNHYINKEVDRLQGELEQAAAREALLTQRMDDAAHDIDGNFIDSALSRLRERSGITSEAARELLEKARKWDAAPNRIPDGSIDYPAWVGKLGTENNTLRRALEAARKWHDAAHPDNMCGKSEIIDAWKRVDKALREVGE